MKIFKINDCEFWMAPNAKRAIKDYAGDFAEIKDYDVEQLSPHELDGFRLASGLTFRDEMARRVANGALSEWFTCTD